MQILVCTLFTIILYNILYYPYTNAISMRPAVFIRVTINPEINPTLHTLALVFMQCPTLFNKTKIARQH